MSQTIKKSIGEGFGKGELYAALAYDSTDRFGGMRVKSMYFSKTLAAATDRAIQIATTNALTTGTVRSFELNQTHTGVGAIAEALTSIVTTNVACGAWANAIFAKLDFSTVGKVTGLAGVICAELTMAGGAVSQGTYCAYQAEINLPTSYSSGVPLHVMQINVWGDQKADFDTYGKLFEITGITSNNSGFWKDGTMSAGDAQETIKVKTPGGIRYIALYDSR